MGLGLLGGGVATVNFILNQGAKVTITDLKSKKELAPAIKKIKGKVVKYVLGKHRIKEIEDNQIIIKNPSIPKNSSYLAAARRLGKLIENDASLFFRLCPDPIIGVTGTKGKSTTVSIIEQILLKAGQKPVLVGHNTTPVLSQLELITKSQPIVFELSSWRLERLPIVEKSPHLAVITNVLKDHLNKYDSFKEYIADKKNIFRYQNKNDFAILNLDNPITRSMGREVRSKRFWFSGRYFAEENGLFIKDNQIIFRRNGKESRVADLSNQQWDKNAAIENILAAVLVAKLMGIQNRFITSGLDGYQTLNGRMEKIATTQGITFINDTCATIPEATINALDRFSKKVILIAGGEDKNLEYSKLARNVSSKTKSIHFIEGSATKKIVKLIDKKKVAYTVSPTIQQAFSQATALARKGDTIVLSPAAASFGKYFINEFDRGKQFNLLVKNFKRK